MTGVPRPDLALFNGWEGGSGDEIVKDNNGDSNMFGDNEKKVITDTSIDEEVMDDTVNNNDLGKETEVLSGLLENLGLKYNSAVTMSCRTTQGMAICNMTCKVDTLTSFNTKLARPNRAAAMLAATIEITAKLERKFFPEKLESNQEQTLVELWKSSKEPDPLFPSWLEKGLYCARVEVEEEEATAGAAYQVLAEAECSAPKLWIDMFGGEVMEVKTVPHSEAFVNNVNDSVVEQASNENFRNRVTVLCNVGAPESYRRPKQGGLFSSLDIMAKDELSVDSSGTPDINTPFALLDKKKKNTKEAKHWSTRKKSPVKRSSSTFLEEDKKPQSLNQ